MNMTSPTRQLFGTDGIRGVAGEFPLTTESTYLIGRALGHDLIRTNAKPKVVIGQDTRASSGWIADRVALGLASVGVDVDSAGVITTPGVAYLARSRKYAAGVVISASHNPWTDNGIKVFSGDGFKLPDARELAIEQEIFGLLQNPEAHPEPAGKPAESLPGSSDLRHAYIDWLASDAKIDLSSLRVLVDCANGAAAAEAPELFRALRVQATIVSASPDGKNINEGCGALHPQIAAKRIASERGKFDMGVTFDGDADRALFSDGDGNVVNGDAVLLLAARDMQSRGLLPGNTIVATTMSNMGLEIALRNSGIRMLRANVGDKYVLEEMLKTGAKLGGEQSGHIILSDISLAGDGLVTAIELLRVVRQSGKSLAELASEMKTYPQILINVRVKSKPPLEELSEIKLAMEGLEADLQGRGRLLVRYSGTENLARVMIEGEEQNKIEEQANDLAELIRRVLN